MNENNNDKLTKEKVIDVIEQKLENSIYMMKSEPLKHIEVDENMVEANFNDFDLYVKDLLEQTRENLELRARVERKIYSISSFSKAQIESRFANCRAEESESIASISLQGEEYLSRLEQLELTEISQSISQDSNILESNMEQEKSNNNLKIRENAKSIVSDELKSRMIQEIRGALRDEYFFSKEEFFQQVKAYIDNHLTERINNGFDDVSHQIDGSTSKILQNSLDDIKKGIMQNVEENTLGEQKNDFMADLKGMTNTQEEIADSEANREQADKSKEDIRKNLESLFK